MVGAAASPVEEAKAATVIIPVVTEPVHNPVAAIPAAVAANPSLERKQQRSELQAGPRPMKRTKKSVAAALAA
eukprot:2707981-Prymnesium_polylepis.1